MPLYDAIETYFLGERQLGLTLVPLGLVALGAAWWAWRAHPGAFGVALAIPVLLLGLGSVAGGAVLAVRTPAQVEALEAAHAERPGAALAAERERMRAVNANWSRLKALWTGLAILGFALIMLGRRDWMSGLGLGLVVIGAVFICVDVTAERRARIYGAVLEAAP